MGALHLPVGKPLDYQHWPCLSSVFILPKQHSVQHALTTKWQTLEKQCFLK